MHGCVTWCLSRCAPTHLEASQALPFLLALCCDGTITVWDLQTEEQLMSDSVIGVLSAHSGEGIVQCAVTPAGVPIVRTTFAGEFSYHLKLKTWLRLSDTNFIHSNFYSSLQSVSMGGSVDEPRAKIDQGRHISRGLLGSLASADMQERAQATTAHLETQIASASKLFSGNSAQKQKWLEAYVRHLTNAGMEGRLRELCILLQGHPVLGASGSMGIDDSTKVLQEVVLPIMGGNRGLQRLVNEFQVLQDGMAQSIIDRGALGALGMSDTKGP